MIEWLALVALSSELSHTIVTSVQRGADLKSAAAKAPRKPSDKAFGVGLVIVIATTTAVLAYVFSSDIGRELQLYVGFALCLAYVAYPATYFIRLNRYEKYERRLYLDM